MKKSWYGISEKQRAKDSIYMKSFVDEWRKLQAGGVL